MRKDITIFVYILISCMIGEGIGADPDSIEALLKTHFLNKEAFGAQQVSSTEGENDSSCMLDWLLKDIEHFDVIATSMDYYKDSAKSDGRVIKLDDKHWIDEYKKETDEMRKKAEKKKKDGISLETIKKRELMVTAIPSFVQDLCITGEENPIIEAGKRLLNNLLPVIKSFQDALKKSKTINNPTHCDKAIKEAVEIMILGGNIYESEMPKVLEYLRTGDASKIKSFGARAKHKLAEIKSFAKYTSFDMHLDKALKDPSNDVAHDDS